MGDLWPGMIGVSVILGALWTAVSYEFAGADSLPTSALWTRLWPPIKRYFLPWYLLYGVVFALREVASIQVPGLSYLPSPYFFVAVFPELHLLHKVLLMGTPLVLIALATMVHAEDKAGRDKTLSSWAQLQGYDCSLGDSELAAAVFSSFRAVAPTTRGGCRNAVKGRYEGQEFLLFDLSVSWTTKRIWSSRLLYHDFELTTYLYPVPLAQSCSLLLLPKVVTQAFCPEQHRVGQELTLDEHPRLAERFVARSDDPEQARGLLTGELAELLMSLEGVAIEARAGGLVLYRVPGFWQTGDLRDFKAETIERRLAFGASLLDKLRAS